MSEKDHNIDVKTPWHIWFVGVIGFLWNSMGAMDFVMTQTKNEEYMKAFTAEQLDFFYGFPIWLVVIWGVAVWGGVIGCIALLMRKTIAVWIFLASFIAMVVTSFHNFVLSNGLEVIGDTFSLVFSAVIFLSAFGFYWYSKLMNNRRVLN